MNRRLKALSWTMRFFAIGGLIFLLSGCLDDDMGDVQQTEVAYMSIYHASPDAADMDIYFGTNKINNSPFSYGDYSGGYVYLLPGERDVEFIDADDDETVLLDTTLTFEKNKYYSVFLADSVASLETIVLRDSSETAPASGKAMVRYLHLSPGTPAAAVLGDEETLFDAVPYKGFTQFEEVDAGTITLEFVDPANENEVLLTKPSVQISAQRYYTIVLRGFASPPDGNDNEISADVLRQF